MVDKKRIFEVSMEVLKIAAPITWLVVDSAEKNIKKSSEVTERGDIEEMNREALRQEITSRIQEAQAKVAQEIAIARRIDTAEEVTIEEFYDICEEGNIGLTGNADGITLGASGSGKRVTKRIYTFKGWRDGGLEIINNLKDKKNI